MVSWRSWLPQSLRTSSSCSSNGFSIESKYGPQERSLRVSSANLPQGRQGERESQAPRTHARVALLRLPVKAAAERWNHQEKPAAKGE
jgi:hypothetical protein